MRERATSLVLYDGRLIGCLLALGLAGCYTPAGLRFEPAPALGTDQALAYVYHVSPSRSVRDYGERIFVDGTELGLLQTGFGDSCEYLWLPLAPGRHRFEVRTNSHWFNLGSIKKNPVALDLTAKAESVYVVRVATSRNLGMSVGVAAGTSGGVQSQSGTHVGPGGKTISYSEGLEDTDLRGCHLVETSEAP